MEKDSKTYLPSSISSSLMNYEPIPILPPKHYKFKDIEFDTKIKSISKNHFLEESFRPYLRASRQVNAIKKIYNNYCLREFDMSVEYQNNDYTASRLPEKTFHHTKKEIIQKPSFKIRKKVTNFHKFLKIDEEFYNKFDVQLSNLCISSCKLKTK